MTESTVTTLCLVDSLDRLPSDMHIFLDHKLGYTLAVGDSVRIVRQIDGYYAYLATVIGINGAGGVHQGNTMLQSKP